MSVLGTVAPVAQLVELSALNYFAEVEFELLVQIPAVTIIFFFTFFQITFNSTISIHKLLLKMYLILMHFIS